jgi:predicted membrane chloride channel (bestrophin family)
MNRLCVPHTSYDAHLTARFEAGELTTNSVTLARQNWRNWIEPNLSDVRVKDMSKAKVLEFVDAMRGKLAAASQRSVLTALSGLLDYELTAS